MNTDVVNVVRDRTAAPAPVEPARRPLLVTGYWIAQMIHVAARLNLADLLDDQPRTCHELAQATGAHEPSLSRLLRALIGAGLVEAVDGDRVTLTPHGEQLRSRDPMSVHAFAAMLGEEHYRAWGGLYQSVMTGRTAFDEVFGCSLFEYFERAPRMAALFHDAMAEVAGRIAPAVLRAYDFSSISHLVDVGGGTGALLTPILIAHPALEGTICDAATAVAPAVQRLAEAGLSSRARAVAANFFASVPAADAYILRGVIHDWDDDRARTILDNCRRAASGPRPRILVVEHVIPDDARPSFSRLQDLDMLVMTGGRERTEAEYRRLFSAAGLTLQRMVPTTAGVSVLEGVPRDPSVAP